jgi:tetratricopeptide (TPR) repeat protein
MERAEEIISLCDAHGIKAIVGVEPNKPEDITDIERALSRAEARPGTSDTATTAVKVGRNAPCLCGSGRKYKKCCGRDNGRHDASSNREETSSLPREIRDDIERLERWSNGVLDAIEARRYAEAEDLCRRLAEHYPELIDSHERLAALRSAQGRWREAADAYDQAIEVIARSPNDYDRGLVADFCRSRDEAWTKAGLPNNKPLPPEIAAHIAPAPLRLVQNIVRKIRGF